MAPSPAPLFLDYKEIFEFLPSPCLLVRPDLTIIAANKAYRQVTLTENKEITGRDLFEVFPANPASPDDKSVERLRASLERVMATKKPDTMPLQKYDIPTGQETFEERHWSPLNVPVLSKHGDVICIIHRVEDVTDLVKTLPMTGIDNRAQELAVELFRRRLELETANRKLLETNDKLHALDQSKTDFFNDVSHELRTPLTLLLWSLDQLTKVDRDRHDSEMKALTTATRNAKRMLRLVNTLLEFARADAGRVKATYQPTDLTSLTKELASQFRTAVEQAGLRLTVQCEPLPQPVYVDREMWEKILLNLLSNAFKFTAHGEIRVMLENKNDWAQLTVADTGSGISAEDVPLVFDRFFRSREPRVRGEEGSGIGLALVKELVRFHGGDIQVKSVKGQGTSFIVSLPFGRAHLPAKAVREDPEGLPLKEVSNYVEEVHNWLKPGADRQESADGRSAPGNVELVPRARVLVVDDSAELGTYIARLLGERFQTETATEGARALAAIYHNPPDVLVTDLLMAGLGGIDLVRAIRTDPVVSTLPIIIVSGRADEDERSAALEAGADDFLVKPFNARELLARVTLLVEQSERNRHERRLRADAEAARARMRMVLDSVSEAFVAVDRNWHITYANGKAGAWLAAAPEELQGKPLSQFFAHDLMDVLRPGLQETMARRSAARLEYCQATQWWSVSIFPSPEGVVVLASDVTERKEAEERMLHLAHHDALTGLHNRCSMSEFGQLLIASTQRLSKILATLFIDLDQFKSINDTYGHDIGDQLLQQVAQRLRQSLRAEDLTARLGGDEFIALLPNLNSANDAARVTSGLLERLNRPYMIEGKEIYCSPSIGVSLYPSDGRTLADLVQNADAAMYEAKEAGRNSYRFYTLSPGARNRDLLSLEQRLRRGVHGQGFQVFYQPIISAQNQEVCGAEALLRWPQPGNGMIRPDVFIPIAESIGIISALGRWVFDEVCRQIRAWKHEGLEFLRVAVNVSPIQFRQPDFLQSLLGILNESGVGPQNLSLELTESALLKNIDESVRMLLALRDAGLTVALDDFGTGYSSLSQLARLPVDKLKIDQSFVRSIEQGGPAPAIIEAIIALGRALNLKIVAEGVESEGDFAFLRERCCDQMQGYLFGRPMSGAEFFEWWKNRDQKSLH
ncbi:MAG TPA: EAL domain-containing protein [Noviherbaspirillum sp.]|nr:EAL domain-containing protein [Noviherbaspirillum sp.]